MLGRVTQQFAALVRFSKPFFTGQYLVIINTASCGVLLGAGDVIEQSLERRQKLAENWDTVRTVHMFFTGCSMGPLLHYWYSWLDRRIPAKGVKSIKSVTLKVTIDQIFSPVFGCWYFVSMGLFEGHSWAESWNEFREKFWEYYTAELCVWPACQMINFLFLPPAYRVLFVNTVILGWNVYLSYLKHRR
ncbi:mpv17-like protein 2 [Hemicordylus capensis]|uniref:mpv17-like protein 2 n=1 Tax=Hemicordylus capensis TaxID=884348 RepID=UPI002303C81E|nr:mpv17-like protein 2 [Hemicordylus capensis]